MVGLPWVKAIHRPREVREGGRLAKASRSRPSSRGCDFLPEPAPLTTSGPKMLQPATCTVLVLFPLVTNGEWASSPHLLLLSDH